MPSESVDLFNFMYDGKKVWVYTGSGTNSVFYKIGTGSGTSAGLRYNDEKGWFVRTSGAILKHEDAKSYIRELL